MCLSLVNDVIIIIVIVIVIIDTNISIIALFYKYWFLIGLINRILYRGTSSLKHLSLFKGLFHPGDGKFIPGQIFT